MLRKHSKQAARQTERINGCSKDNEDKQKIPAIWKNYVWNMEDGGVDTPVIDRWQHKMAKMADFPPLLTSSIFNLYKQETPQIESQTMRHTLMNLVNTTLFI